MDRGYQNHPQTPKSQPPFPFNPGENHQDTFEWETKVCVHLGMKPVTLMETMSPALALFTASRVTPRTTVISLEFLRFFHPFPQSQSTQKHRKGQKTLKKKHVLFISKKLEGNKKKRPKSAPRHFDFSRAHHLTIKALTLPIGQGGSRASKTSPKSGSVNDKGGGTFFSQTMFINNTEICMKMSDQNPMK